MKRTLKHGFWLLPALVVVLAAQPQTLADSSDESIDDLRAEQFHFAKEYYTTVSAAHEAGTASFNEVVAGSKELFAAQHAMAATPDKRIAACKEYVARESDAKKKVQALFESGSLGGEAEKYALAKLSLVKAKILLVQEEKGAQPRK